MPIYKSALRCCLQGMPEPVQRGWYSRGYLPHLDFRSAIQGVTFRLADSVPKKVVQLWKAELTEDDAGELRRRIAAYEDAGYGECWLRDSENATILEDALRHFDGEHYDLLEWVVMPNHVHVLFRPHSMPMDRIVQRWKRFSAWRINERLGRAGRFWARDYFDRFIRDEAHFLRARKYVRENPVRAGLCPKAEDWLFGSARRG